MEKIKQIWYRLFARRLHEEHLANLSSLAYFTSELKKANRKINTYQQDNKDLKKQNRALDNKLECALNHVDPIARGIDQNRHHAAQGRITDLEREVEHLRKLLKKK